MRKITVFLLLCCIGWLLSARAADSVKNTNNGVLKQSVYIDFGKNNGLDGNVTEGPDQNGHYWNNAIETEYEVWKICLSRKAKKRNMEKHWNW